MKRMWLAVGCFVLAVTTRLTHIGENHALTYRPNASVTYAISLNTILLWSSLAVAGLLTLLKVVQLVRVR
jgi:hypothetical protein